MKKLRTKYCIFHMKKVIIITYASNPEVLHLKQERKFTNRVDEFTEGKKERNFS